MKISQPERAGVHNLWDGVPERESVSHDVVGARTSRSMKSFRQRYLTERINYIVPLESIHPQPRQLDVITRNSKIKLTGLWVN